MNRSAWVLECLRDGIEEPHTANATRVMAVNFINFVEEHILCVLTACVCVCLCVVCACAIFFSRRVLFSHLMGGTRYTPKQRCVSVLYDSKYAMYRQHSTFIVSIHAHRHTKMPNTHFNSCFILRTNGIWRCVCMCVSSQRRCFECVFVGNKSPKKIIFFFCFLVIHLCQNS